MRCMSTIQLCVKMLQQSMNNQLTELFKLIKNWIDVNRIVLNTPKTESMLMETVQRLRSAIYSFSIGEDEFTITVVNTYKLLVLHVDNLLTWERHVASIVSKVRSRLHVLNKTKHLLPLQSRIDVYTTIDSYNQSSTMGVLYGEIVEANCT